MAGDHVVSTLMGSESDQRDDTNEDAVQVGIDVAIITFARIRLSSK